jgi:hypothetical protein
MVILLDSDVYRENSTMPGGLPLYGKTAALAAGHPDRFLDYYAIMSNFDPLPAPRLGPLAPPAPRRTTSPARSAHTSRRRSPARSSGGSRSRMRGSAEWPTRSSRPDRAARARRRDRCGVATGRA